MSGSPSSVRDTAQGALFRIRVVPRASRSEVAGFEGEALKLRITEAPVEGRANDACVGLLARRLGVKKAQVTIIAGHTARNKTVAVEGLTAAQVASLIGAP